MILIILIDSCFDYWPNAKYLWKRQDGLNPRETRLLSRPSDRVAQVIANRRKEALELGLSPDVAESVWRSMIKAFIALEEKVNKE